MTFLPIVDRELRVAARRRATYWTRVIAAVFALVIAGGILILSEVGRRFVFGQLGPMLFGIFSWLGFIFVCSAGPFLTSDCLSEEKREGTLGLLFLTDLRGYDVVAGKLLATSLRGAYGLLAVFPVFALTFLLGGVTGRELWRLVVVLANTLFFSLAAGVLVSSLSRDSQKAMNGTLLVCALFMLLLPTIDWFVAGWDRAKFVPRGSVASPSWAFMQIGSRTGVFWPSLAVVHGLGWLFFGLACLFARRTWQERGVALGGTSPSTIPRWRYGSPERRSAFRRRLLEGNPIRWLAGRDLWLLVLVRVILFSMLGVYVIAGLVDRRIAFEFGYVLGALLGFVFVLWVASHASRFFVESTRTGAMELMLVSRTTVEEIVSGCWWSLKRAFLLPAVVLLAMKAASTVMQIAEMKKAWAGIGTATPTPVLGMASYQIIALVSGLVLFVTGTAAVAWFGMWMGLTTKTPHLAVIKTVLITKVVPWFPLMFIQGILMALAGFSQWPFWLVSAVGAVLSLAVDIAFILVARNRLLTRFREAVTRVESPIRVAQPPPLPAAAIRPSA